MGQMQDILDLLLTFGIAADQRAGEEAANKENNKRYYEAKNKYQEEEDRFLGTATDEGELARNARQRKQGMVDTENVNRQDFAELLRQITSGDNARMGGIFQQYDASFGPIRQMLQDRYTRNMGTLEGMGAQERKDINQSYDSLGNKVDADLIARGVRSGSLSPSLQAGVNRERRDSVGRLEERLRREKVGADTQLSGDIINAESTNRTNRTNLMTSLTGEALGRKDALLAKGFDDRSTFRQNQYNLDDILFKERMAFDLGSTEKMNALIASRNDTGPNPAVAASLIQGIGEAGQNRRNLEYQQSQQPNWFEKFFMPGIGAGTGMAVGGATLGGLNFLGGSNFLGSGMNPFQYSGLFQVPA